MENQFNLKLQAWLNDENHTISDGCLLLLQMENNQIHYQNLIRHPNKVAVMQFLESELQKRLKVRLANITHKMVAEMEEKVKVIVKKHYAYQDAAAEGTSDEEFRKGKRADHDRLPEEIQALYVENLELLHRMREMHLKLRSLSLQQVSCPDSERYPFLKEIIELDKKSHENWKTYDHYILPDSSSTSASPDSSPSSSTSPAASSTSSPPAASPAVVPGDLPAGDAASPSPSPTSPKSPKSTKKSASPKK
jgi:hypothetical protein